VDFKEPRRAPFVAGKSVCSEGESLNDDEAVSKDSEGPKSHDDWLVQDGCDSAPAPARECKRKWESDPAELPQAHSANTTENHVPLSKAELLQLGEENRFILTDDAVLFFRTYGPMAEFEDSGADSGADSGVHSVESPSTHIMVKRARKTGPKWTRRVQEFYASLSIARKQWGRCDPDDYNPDIVYWFKQDPVDQARIDRDLNSVDFEVLITWKDVSNQIRAADRVDPVTGKAVNPVWKIEYALIKNYWESKCHASIEDHETNRTNWKRHCTLWYTWGTSPTGDYPDTVLPIDYPMLFSFEELEHTFIIFDYYTFCDKLACLFGYSE
jgi:hypothetical protein